MSEFHEIASSLRKRMGLTQAEMAKEFGLSRSYYAEIENGNREPSGTLIRMLSMMESLAGLGALKGQRQPVARSVQEESDQYAKREKLNPMDRRVIARADFPPPSGCPDRSDCTEYFEAFLDRAEQAERPASAISWTYEELRRHFPLNRWEEDSANEERR